MYVQMLVNIHNKNSYSLVLEPTWFLWLNMTLDYVIMYTLQRLYNTPENYVSKQA